MGAVRIRNVLRRRYGSSNASAIAFEVAHGTGRHAHRHVDAVVMDLWPSRGLTLHAMEIKCSVSDLKREIADGSKAEEIAQHCDLFSLVTPLGLVTENRMNEIPRAWGLIEVDGNDNLRFTKPAVKTRARPVDRLFMASMLRAGYATVGMDAKVEIEKEKRTLYEKYRTDVDERAKEYSKHGALWDELMKQLKNAGIAYAWDKDVLASLVFVLKSRMLIRDGMRDFQKKMSAAIEEIKIGLDGMGVPR